MAGSYSTSKGIIFDIGDTLCAGPFTVDGCQLAKVREGTPEALSALRQKGIRLGAMTLGLESKARNLLRLAELDQFFDEGHVLGGESRRDVARTVETRQRAPGIRGMLGGRVSVHQTVTQPEIIPTKPESDGVNYLLGQWGLKPVDILFIGDDAALADSSCALGAGIGFERIDSMILARQPVNMMDFMRELWILR